jgi:hypothetical protein
MKPHRHAIIVSVGAGLLVVLGVAGWLLSGRDDPRPRQFVARWAGVLGQCQDAASAQRLDGPSQPILVRTFGNGEWVAACSESSCGGAGFDATVLRDSRGATWYDTAHHFCGYEGLCGELNAIPASDLDQFYAGLEVAGIHVRPWNASGM